MSLNISGPRRVGDTSPLKGETKPAGSVEESGRVDSRVAAPGTSGIGSAADSKKAIPLQQTPDSTSPTIARKFRSDDIKSLLVEGLNKPLTQENKQILTTILQYGLDASGDNLDVISRLTQGKNQANAIESSVISLLKGVSDTPKSVDIVSKFLNNQINSTQANKQLSISLSQFQQFFSTLERALPAGLFSNLSEILDGLDRNLKKQSQINQETALLIALQNKGATVKEFHLFTGLLAGLADQIAQSSPELEANYRNQLNQLKESIGKFIESNLSQAIISKENTLHNIGFDEFSYWQIPNPLSENKKPIELLIKRDKNRNKDQKFDPEKTKIVLKCETEDIGELSIIVEITGKKVWYLFFTENLNTKMHIRQTTKDLQTRLAALDYELINVQTMPKKLNIKRLLLPTVNLDKLSRISTQV